MSPWSVDDEGYTALSYVWGNDPPIKTIKVNGRDMMIRKNLDSAIRYIREERQPLRLWVDAICINQQDLSERTAQVEMMSEIYQQAQSLIVFLGEGEDLSTLFTFIQDIDDGSPIDGTLDKSDMPRVLDQFWQLLQMPWWSRVWVIQEFAYADARPTFMYGHRQFSARWLWYGFGVLRDILLDDLYSSIKRSDGNLQMSGSSLRLWSGAGSVFYGLHILRSRQQLFRWRQRSFPARSKVSELLKDTQFYQATEPRDRLFGLHSLMMDPFRACFLPDYGQSMRAANIRMAAYLLCIEGWTDMYNYFPTAIDGTLPSWVPDFSANMERDKWSRIWDSSSSLCLGELECWAHTAVLGIRGIDCGGVTEITGLDWQDSNEGPACPPSSQTKDYDVNSLDTLSRILADTKPEPDFPTNDAELEEWRKDTTRWLLFADLVRTLDMPQDLDVAPSSDLSVAQDSGSVDDFPSFLEDHRKSTAAFQSSMKLFKSKLTKYHYDALDDTRWKRRPNLTALEIEEQLRQEPAQRKDNIDVAWRAMKKMQFEQGTGRPYQDEIFQGFVFTTDLDFAGLCPLQAQIGDRLVVLFGMPTPFLARLDGSDGVYRLIGAVRANNEALQGLRTDLGQESDKEHVLYFK
ncbi:hypothetical protein ACHAPT_008780 [Fusarium lateritium]